MFHSISYALNLFPVPQTQKPEVNSQNHEKWKGVNQLHKVSFEL